MNIVFRPTYLPTYLPIGFSLHSGREFKEETEAAQTRDQKRSLHGLEQRVRQRTRDQKAVRQWRVPGRVGLSGLPEGRLQISPSF